MNQKTAQPFVLPSAPDAELLACTVECAAFIPTQVRKVMNTSAALGHEKYRRLSVHRPQPQSLHLWFIIKAVGERKKKKTFKMQIVNQADRFPLPHTNTGVITLFIRNTYLIG